MTEAAKAAADFAIQQQEKEKKEVSGTATPSGKTGVKKPSPIVNSNPNSTTQSGK